MKVSPKRVWPVSPHYASTRATRRQAQDGYRPAGRQASNHSTSPASAQAAITGSRPADATAHRRKTTNPAPVSQVPFSPISHVLIATTAVKKKQSKVSDRLGGDTASRAVKLRLPRSGLDRTARQNKMKDGKKMNQAATQAASAAPGTAIRPQHLFAHHHKTNKGHHDDETDRGGLASARPSIIYGVVSHWWWSTAAWLT
jgi:hypothetical protein